MKTKQRLGADHSSWVSKSARPTVFQFPGFSIVQLKSSAGKNKLLYGAVAHRAPLNTIPAVQWIQLQNKM